MSKKKYNIYRNRNILTEEQRSFEYQKRYINTYKLICDFSGKILDLGCGSKDFVKTANKLKYNCIGIDKEECNFEMDKLPYKNNVFNIVHLNAVIEHIQNPINLLKEIKRVLKVNGIVIINTPNFQQDYLNFYNDPTHIKPYTPKGLNWLMEMSEFKTIFLEPALIMYKNSKIIYKMKNKWDYASKVKNGSKSILGVFRKEKSLGAEQ